MVLAVHSNASYLHNPQARREGGHFFMSSNTTFPANDGTIHNTTQVIKAVMSSAIEAELGALYISAKFVALAQQMIKELGHTQPPMPIQTDNSTTFGVITNKMIPKPTKAFDMYDNWLHNQKQQQQFCFYW